MSTLSKKTLQAIELMRNGHVLTFVSTSTGITNSWKIPEFSWTIGIHSTKTGRRVHGFGVRVYTELRNARMLDKPVGILVAEGKYTGDPIYDRVYTLKSSPQVFPPALRPKGKCGFCRAFEPYHFRTCPYKGGCAPEPPK